ncbi:MAG: hypothetical protein ACLUQK_03355 [Clostridium sp.]|jgi:hypothetical protein|nr:hypothetical protein [[Clostridium] innocuum]QSI25293.1 hypothetical protein GKZ87_07255 [Erysipelotrichaceae bacterium 66202529]DAQ27840.1 MAG TPA: Head Tail Connector Protein [Caudoviricetes sp.]
MPYTTYEFYTRDFYGDMIPQESFSKYELKARFELDRYTFGRVKGLPITTVIEQCMCELMEYLFANDHRAKGNGISSESTDGHSVTFKDEKTVSVINKELRQIVSKHLAGTGLMYRGITAC